MPFRVHYEIYNDRQAAPEFETYDRTLAYIEWNARKKSNPLTRMVPEVTPENLTKPEEYVWLVYRVLKDYTGFGACVELGYRLVENCELYEKEE